MLVGTRITAAGIKGAYEEISNATHFYATRIWANLITLALRELFWAQWYYRKMLYQRKNSYSRQYDTHICIIDAKKNNPKISMYMIKC